MNQEKIRNFIKDLRTKNNLTQEEFAKMFGVTYQAVSKWENGKNIPDISILKEMSNKFNFDINDLLEGNNKKNNNILFIISGLLIIIGIILLVILIPKDNFEFKQISTSCKDFEITGSAAYNSDNTSIYISNINYCGKKDDTIYKRVECKLYESYNDSYSLISSCQDESNINLNDYLDGVKLNVDNYNASCKRFKDSSLILEINAYVTDDDIKTYKIPITLKDNC